MMMMIVPIEFSGKENGGESAKFCRQFVEVRNKMTHNICNMLPVYIC
jgi:hypothetical protein